MLMTAKRSDAGLSIPFDSELLDHLMEAARLDILIATSKHNVQYLLGGHRALFFDYMDAMGISRYLPVFVYPNGAPQDACYVGHRLEGFQRELRPFWVPEAQTSSSGSVDAMQKAVEHVRRRGLGPLRIGAELAFLPVDAAAVLRAAFPDAELLDAVFVLERLRARKSPAELDKIRVASERVIDSMLSVIARHGPGTTKSELVEALRREEVNRGLTFEYCLITMGTSLNRAPSEQSWQKGDILSLDSGGNYHGYIGDLCRMAILGEPDAELEDLLSEIETIQRTAMAAVKPGALGTEVYAAVEPLLARSRQREQMHFLAHGMGLVSHEAPHLTSRGPVPYADDDAHRPLEPGMVVSVETTLRHLRRGFVKLEDTVAVTSSGREVYGERGRGWNRAGTAIV
jgi:Xaa-Pro aminopeptidase